MTPKLDKHQRLSLLHDMQERFAGGWIKYGWQLNGPGPARFGWWRISVAGAATYLGRKFEEAEKALQSPTS